MPATLTHQLAIEKTPSYFVTHHAAERVSRDMPRDIRLLVVVRDPVTRALSDYTQSAAKRSHLAKFETRALIRRGNRTLVNGAWSPIRLGLYSLYVRPWLDRFAPEQLLFVRGERLVADPAAEMATVQRFLGLRPLISSRNFHFNETKGFPCLRRWSGGPARCLGRSKGRRHPPVDATVLQRLREFYRPYNDVFYKMTGIHLGRNSDS